MPEQEPKKKPSGIAISTETQATLEQAKHDGFSKGSVMDEAIAFWRFLFYSTEDLATTKNVVMDFRILKKIRDHLAQKEDINPTIIKELDNLIAEKKEVLLQLEKGEYGKCQK